MTIAGFERTFASDPMIDITCEPGPFRTLRQRVPLAPHQIALIDTLTIAWADPTEFAIMKEIADRISVILFGSEISTKDQRRAFDAGIRGIIARTSQSHQIRTALVKVGSGGISLEAPIAEALLNNLLTPSPFERATQQKLETITKREYEIIESICMGLKNKQIAAQLHISETTVWHHLTSIYSKLGVSDRLSLVAFAYHNDIHLANQRVLAPLQHSKPHSRDG